MHNERSAAVMADIFVSLNLFGKIEKMGKPSQEIIATAFISELDTKGFNISLNRFISSFIMH